MLDNFDDLDIPEDEDAADGDSNRSFLTVTGGIGALIVVSLLMLAGNLFFFRPDPAAVPPTEVVNSEIVQQATTDALNRSLTETAIASANNALPTNTSIPPTATEVVTEEVLAPTQDPLTATVEALLTQASMAQTQAVLLTGTPTPIADGELPTTGFLDDFGIPGLVSLSLLMVFIIFMARRLRQVNS